MLETVLLFLRSGYFSHLPGFATLNYGRLIVFSQENAPGLFRVANDIPQWYSIKKGGDLT